MKTRKLIGLLAVLIFITLYCFAGMLLAVNFLPDNRWVELVFYPVVGILWIFPVMKIIRFMEYTGDADAE
jgi:predicted membrane channel-forming protein YqfA (hemolysin III family)